MDEEPLVEKRGFENGTPFEGGAARGKNDDPTSAFPDVAERLYSSLISGYSDVGLLFLHMFSAPAQPTRECLESIAPGIACDCVVGMSCDCVVGIPYDCVVGIPYDCVVGIPYDCVVGIPYDCVVGIGIACDCVVGYADDALVMA